MRYPYFVGPSYQAQNKSATSERLINWYPEAAASPGAKASLGLMPAPGFRTFVDLAETPVRGLFALDGRCFAAAGYGLYELFGNGTWAYCGAIERDERPVTFCSNGDGGDEIFLTSGGVGYRFDLTTNTLTVELSSANVCGFLDGFFLSLDMATSTLRISNLLDGSTWDAGKVTQRTAGADKWLTLAVVNRSIWLFGSQTTEVWYNAGLPQFPFAPIPGAFMDTGIGALASIARVDNSLMWLGANDQGERVIYRANGYTPVRISTHAVEAALSKYAAVSDAVGWSYQEEGHTFYVLTFPSANATWVYDAATGLWHERLFYDVAGAGYVAYRPQVHAFTFGRHLVGDRLSGVVSEMSVNLATDVDGRGIRRVRRAPILSAEEGWIVYHSFQLDLETGLGLPTGQGADPQIMLRLSRDGGHSWGAERWVSAGRMGQYGRRAIWRRLGRARNLTAEIAVSDPIPWRLTDAFIQLERGAA